MTCLIRQECIRNSHGINEVSLATENQTIKQPPLSLGEK